MMSVELQQVALFFFFGLFTLAFSDVYYVTPSSNVPCPEKESPCLTLSQYANKPSDYFASNTTLILLPGNHQLEGNVSFLEDMMMEYVAIIASDSLVFHTVFCQNVSSFRFEKISLAVVSGVTFVSCKRNVIRLVSRFVFTNCTFTNTSGEHTLFIDGSGVLIQDSFITDNDVAFDCGVVICNNSELQLKGNFVSNNKFLVDGTESDKHCFMLTEYYYSSKGVFWSMNSSLTLFESTFHAHSVQPEATSDSIANMGVFVTITTNFTISSSNFTNNEYYCVQAWDSTTTINNCHFEKNYYYLIYSGFKLDIYSSIFTQNSILPGRKSFRPDDLIYATTELSIYDSLFTDNSETSGLASISDSKCSSCSLFMYNSTFRNNTQHFMIEMRTKHGLITALICDTIFEYNKIIDNIGGMIFSSRTIGGPIYITVNNSIFTKNYGREITSFNSDILVINSTFSHNIDGFFMAISSNVTFMTNLVFSDNIFHNGSAIWCFRSDVTFIGNGVITKSEAEYYGGGILSTECRINIVGDLKISHNKANISGGGIFAIRSEINVRGENVEIANNQARVNGGGLYATGTTINLLGGHLTFENNTAEEKGGGCYMDANARLYVIKSHEELIDSDKRTWLKLKFLNNVANSGGAIYVADDTYSGVCKNNYQTLDITSCFFQVLTAYAYKGSRCAISNKHNIFFNNNKANQAGDDLYGGLIDRCTLSHDAELSEDICSPTFSHGKKYIKAVSNINITPTSVSSAPVRVCFCLNNKPVCKYHLALKVLKGRNFTVKVVAVDQIETPVPATVYSYLSSNHSLNLGPFSQKTNANCTDLTYNILSRHKSVKINLYSEGPCSNSGISRNTFTVIFLPCSCPLGFQKRPVHNKCSCKCDPRLKSFINCSYNTNTVQRIGQSDSWITFSNVAGFVAYKHCPFDYCYPTSENTARNIDFNITNSLCNSNRAGKLCGCCESGYSLTLGSLQCKICTSTWLFLLLPFALGGVFLVAFVLVCNLTVAVGTINGLIFYANIAAARSSILFPHMFNNPVFVSEILSWINLDLGIETCFFDGMDAYMYTWLQLAFPLYLIFLVIVVIIISEHSQRFAKLLSTRNPVETLATIILLSYTKLLRTVIDVTLFAELKHINNGTTETVWLIDGNVPYLKGKHLFLFIVTVFLMFLIIIYTLLIFAWQWIGNAPDWKIFHWTRNTKLIHFMETYHAPFKPKHRYWAGVLLIARIILYVIISINIHGDFRSNLLVIALIVTCLLVLSKKRVYKNWRLELLETLFFANLLLFSVTTFYVRDIKANQTVVAYISAGTTFILFCAILLYHTYAFMLKKLYILRNQAGYSELEETGDFVHDRGPNDYDNLQESLIDKSTRYSSNFQDYTGHDTVSCPPITPVITKAASVKTTIEAQDP